MSIHPFHLVLSALAHWANREQAAIVNYLREENRVLRDRLGAKRLPYGAKNQPTSGRTLPPI